MIRDSVSYNPNAVASTDPSAVREQTKLRQDSARAKQEQQGSVFSVNGNNSQIMGLRQHSASEAYTSRGAMPMRTPNRSAGANGLLDLGQRLMGRGIYNAAGNNIRDAKSIIDMVSNNLLETNIQLNNIRDMVTSASQVSSLTDRQGIQSRINTIIESLNSMQQGNNTAIEQAVARSENDKTLLQQEEEPEQESSRLPAGRVSRGSRASATTNDPLQALAYYASTIRESMTILDNVRDEFEQMDSGALSQDLGRIGQLSDLMIAATEAIYSAFGSYGKIAQPLINSNASLLASKDPYGYIMFNHYMNTYVNYTPFYEANYRGLIVENAGAASSEAQSQNGSASKAMESMRLAIYGGPGMDHGTHGIAANTGGYTGVLTTILGYTESLSSVSGVVTTPISPGVNISGGSNAPQWVDRGQGNSNNNSGQSVVDNNNSGQTVVDNNNSGQTVVDNNNSQTVVDNNNSQTVVDNNNSQTVVDNNNSQTVVDNNNSQTVNDNVASIINNPGLSFLPKPTPRESSPSEDVSPINRETGASLLFQVGVTNTDSWNFGVTLVDAQTLGIADSGGNSRISIVNGFSGETDINLRRIDTAIAFVLQERANLSRTQARLDYDSAALDKTMNLLNPVIPGGDASNNAEMSIVDRESLDKMARITFLQQLSNNMRRPEDVLLNQGQPAPAPGSAQQM